ncbi:hypothetical protein [Agromyces sp. GXS1127]|uniref:hypothetical protein n=1 Tax=Agromyces sp. GXS1127 TaxID=3424181 RepID=UPI003D310766
MHADHCGGNLLFAGTPIHVQRRELVDARTPDEYGRPLAAPRRLTEAGTPLRRRRSRTWPDTGSTA